MIGVKRIAREPEAIRLRVIAHALSQAGVNASAARLPPSTGWSSIGMAKAASHFPEVIQPIARNTSFACAKMERMRIADVEEDIDHELVSKEQIDAKIHEMAALASEDYRDKNPLLVAVLKGAVNTLVAFTQAMSIPVQIDFMSLSSYGSGTVSSGEVTVRQDLSADVRGRHILIVEDIVDSGHTLAWLVAELKRRGAASVEVFALLSKPSRREVDVDVKYAGYEIPDEFVVGFGLDFDERYRNLDSIAVLKPSSTKECKHELPARAG